MAGIGGVNTVVANFRACGIGHKGPERTAVWNIVEGVKAKEFSTEIRGIRCLRCHPCSDKHVNENADDTDNTDHAEEKLWTQLFQTDMGQSAARARANNAVMNKLGRIFNKIMTIEPFGQIVFKSKDNQWFGLLENICPYNKVEVRIAVDNKDQDLKDKIELVKKLAEDYDSIIADLYDLAYKKYKDTAFEVTRKEIEQMYFLTAVDLKKDNYTWWLVLEPALNVDSIYNHFLRFTMVGRKIDWANFDINTTD